ncbi:YfhO family protein [Butyrivibrio sp. XPD2002]|uniref:YfhO family protein n=1 Tax=Butyrivibrio sp. XPD2002 TaxID=1280665 RepID=UPI0004023A31|nr:YfhO family protein [Butyrivibrio sp. XPD2002]
MKNGCQLENKIDHSDFKKKAAITALIAAFFAVLLFMALCVVLHITPFGDKTFLYEDMKQQYVDFFSYYSNVFHGKDGFFYSDNCGLGAKMLGIWAYYLTSPFLLMFVLIPDSYYPVAVTFLIMLKLAAMAGTGSVFFSYISDKFPVEQEFGRVKRQDENGWASGLFNCIGLSNIIASVAFAFSGWMIANMTNIMWLDAVIMMPVVLIGLFMMMRDEKRGRIIYVVSVMIMVVMNYYIAAMVLMFVGLLAFLLCFGGIYENGIRRFFEFIAATLGSLLLDAWFLIPTAMSLMGSNKDHSGKMASAFAKYLPSSEAIGKYISPIAVLPKLFSMSYDSLEIMEGMPNIYFGAALIIPCVLFFFNKAIGRKTKVLMGIYLLVIMMFFCIKPLNTLAHGGTEAYGYLYRYSFVFSFVCVTLVYLNLVNYKGIDLKGVLISGGIAVVLFAIAFLSKPGFIGNKAWVVNAGVLCAVEVLLIALSCGRNIVNMGALAILAIVFAADISMNFICIYRNSSMNAETETGYMAKCEETRATLEDIRSEEDYALGMEWYRIESTSPRTPNDSLHFGYPGTTTYNSLLKVENRLFMYRLGFNDNGLYTMYEEGNTRCADAILGIRYIMNGVDYEKREALPAEFTTGDKIPELLECIEDTKNPFEAQEMLWNKFTGRDDEVFKEAECLQLNEGDNEADDKGSADTCIYEIHPKISGKLYFYMNRDTRADRSLEIYVNGEFTSGYGNASCQKVLDFGYFDEGEAVTLEIRAADGIEGLPDGMVVVTEDLGILEGVFTD